jgi:hypothetical protein
LHFGFISLFFSLSLSLSFSFSFSSANIYIHKSLNCNSKSRLIAAEVTELLMGISRGNEKKRKRKKESNNNKEDRDLLCFMLYNKSMYAKKLLPTPNTECIHTIHT